METAERAWTAEDVMVEDVVIAEPTTPYKVLVEKLWLQGVSGLPVVDSQVRLVGIVSEMDPMSKQEHGGGTEAMDMMRRLSRLMPEEQSANAGDLLAGLPKAIGRAAADIMTLPAITIEPDASPMAPP